MKKAKSTERCTETFDAHRCSKLLGHHGKHLCLDDCWVGWTDAGKARVLAERATAQSAGNEVKQ